jgi:hypothetical protein
MIDPKDLTQGVYKGRRSIGPGVYQTLVIILRGTAPLFQLKVIVNHNDGIDELPHAHGYIMNGLYEITERLSDI